MNDVLHFRLGDSGLLFRYGQVSWSSSGVWRLKQLLSVDFYFDSLCFIFLSFTESLMLSASSVQTWMESFHGCVWPGGWLGVWGISPEEEILLCDFGSVKEKLVFKSDPSCSISTPLLYFYLSKQNFESLLFCVIVSLMFLFFVCDLHLFFVLLPETCSFEMEIKQNNDPAVIAGSFIMCLFDIFFEVIYFLFDFTLFFWVKL